MSKMVRFTSALKVLPPSLPVQICLQILPTFKILIAIFKLFNLLENARKCLK